MKRYFLSRKKAKAINTSQKQVLVSGKKIESVLILVPHTGKDFESTSFSNQVGINDNAVDVVYISETNLKGKEIANEVLMPKSFGVLGKLKSAEISKLIEKKFDMVFSLLPSGIVADYALSHSQGTFKVGFLENNQTEMLQLELGVSKTDSKLYMSELLKYLKILKKI